NGTSTSVTLENASQKFARSAVPQSSINRLFKCPFTYATKPIDRTATNPTSVKNALVGFIFAVLLRYSKTLTYALLQRRSRRPKAPGSGNSLGPCSAVKRVAGSYSLESASQAGSASTMPSDERRSRARDS